LRERAFRSLDSLLGGQFQNESKRMTLFFCTYWIGSTINRIVMTLGIIALVYYLAYQWQLAGLGLAFILVIMICNLILAMASWNTQDRPKTDNRIGQRAFWMGWIAVCLVIAWIVNIPLPNRVETQGVFDLGKRHAVYANSSGCIESISLTNESRKVDRDSSILQLANAPLQRSILSLDSQIARIDQQLKTVQRVSYFDDRVSGSIPSLNAQRLGLSKHLRQKQEESLRLAITAPAEGVFEPALARPAERIESPTLTFLANSNSIELHAPEYWIHPKAIGRTIERGTLVGWVIEDRSPSGECLLDEEQIAGGAVGSEVRVRLVQDSKRVWLGRVSELSKMNGNNESSSKRTAGNGRDELQSMSHRLRVEISADSFDWSDYYSGAAEVVCIRPSRTLLSIAMDQWMRSIRMR